MNNKRIISSIATACFLLAGGLLSSCLEDSPCHYGMKVTVYADNDYKKVGPISLYVLDTDGVFREKLKGNFVEGANYAVFSLDHLTNGGYRLVAWGNEKGSQSMPRFQSGQSTTGAQMKLLSQEGAHICPDELFYGYEEITRQDTEQSQASVRISRCIAGILVKVIGAAHTPEATEEYYVTVKGTLSSLPFIDPLGGAGKTVENEATYRLPVQWDNQMLSTGVRYLFPSAESQQLSVCLYQKEKLIKEYTLETRAQANKIIEVRLNISTAGDWFQVDNWYTIGQEEEV